VLKEAERKAELALKEAECKAEHKAEKDRRVMVQNLKKIGWDIERIAQTMELDREHIKSLYDNPVI
jgi:predicted transposase YdaD